jgi:hypothetical protein
MAVKKKINMLKDIKDPKLREELLFYFSIYHDAKNNKPIPTVKDLLTIDVEKALKKKNYREAKIHLLTMGIKEEHLNDYIKGRKQLRKVN